MNETAGNHGRWRGLVVLARQTGVVAAVVLVVVFGVKPLLEHIHGSAPGVVLTDLHSVADLQARFNADVGTPRLILLLSPTWGTCRAGASWVQQNILAKYPQGRVRVYAVWFNMLWGDSRDGWDSTVLPDARVTHLWDGQKLVGRWFAAQDGDPQGTYWDAYWLYGPAARWDQTPGPLVDSGGPVITVGGQLQSQLSPWLMTPRSSVPPWPLPRMGSAGPAASTW